MSAAVTIGAIIQIITLIVFFVMAGNISKINKRIASISGEEYLRMAEEEKYIGDKEKAKEYLLRAKYRFEVMGDVHNEWKDGIKLSADEIATKINKQISEL